jgi:enoyl-CoA hydratase
VTATPPVAVSDHGPVRILTLNRPERRNAMDAELQEELLNRLTELRCPGDIRAAVLTGEGKAFSAGGDVELIRMMQQDGRLREATLHTWRSLFMEFISMRIPVVAAVNGAAVGAGCTLALLCDVVIMDKDSYLSDPHVPTGLVSGDGAAVVWPLLAGLGAAKAYLLTGDRIPAPEARRLGLAHQVVDSDPVAAALALARRIAAQPAFAVQETKHLLDMHLHAQSHIFDQALEAERRSFDDDEHRDITR